MSITQTGTLDPGTLTEEVEVYAEEVEWTVHRPDGSTRSRAWDFESGEVP